MFKNTQNRHSFIRYFDWKVGTFIKISTFLSKGSVTLSWLFQPIAKWHIYLILSVRYTQGET